MTKDVLPAKQQHLLQSLKEDEIINNFYLAGGTAAALHLSHRISKDFDFFTKEDFFSDVIIQRFKNLGKNYNFIISSQSKGSLHIFIDGLKVSFLYYNYPLIEPLQNYNDIQMASLLDIALMKITAISSRGSKKDFIDLYYICKYKNNTLSELMLLFDQKYKGTGYQIYHIAKSLNYFVDADSEPDPVMLEPFSWDDIKKFFYKESKTLL